MTTLVTHWPEASSWVKRRTRSVDGGDVRELDGQMWVILACAAHLKPDARVPSRTSGIVTVSAYMLLVAAFRCSLGQSAGATGRGEDFGRR